MSVTLDQLNLNVAPAGSKIPLTACVARKLTKEDLALLDTTPLANNGKPLEKIRTVHHSLARLLAAGIKVIEVSAITGYDPTRIAQLQHDPAFSELVAFYREREDARFAKVQDRMVAIGLEAADVIQDRLDNDPDCISTDQLRQLIIATLDRGGFAPVQKKQNLNVTLTAEELAKLKRASNEGTVIIEKTANGDVTPQLGHNGNGGAVKLEVKEAEGVPSQGQGIREEVREVPQTGGD